MEKLAFRNFNVKHLRVNVKMSRELNIRTGIWRHLARVFSGLSLDPQISQTARFNIRFNIRAQRSEKWHFRNSENKLRAQLELQIGFARESSPEFVSFFFTCSSSFGRGSWRAVWIRVILIFLLSIFSCLLSSHLGHKRSRKAKSSSSKCGSKWSSNTACRRIVSTSVLSSSQLQQRIRK